MIPSEVIRAVAARMRDITDTPGQRTVDLPALSFTDALDIDQIARAVLRLKANGWDRT